ncbi:histidine phosphatase family protein [Spiribacter halobius]|uniref:Histidine phosphatase family protein n=1 Tax=Sediminicurvatus halobius TaxID=2182432 RepID=A0A2U2N0T9_9GAMM|nr:histidine phosphatase family protein [Spiribacter halobius]PWG62599.1 histidine phosphatase family protein [Spiribacter halobius]UEX78483.1 histidine phosphatase family protein [Spiribacter halobius]
MRIARRAGRLRRTLLALLLAAMPAVAATSVPWQAIAEGGHAIVFRHAIAPGTGDPPDFTLGDCSTQRNLSAAGREQARAMGERLRANGLDDLPVYTSRWCRCRDTARLLGLGEPQALPSLDSFFRNRERGPEQTRRTRAFLAERHDWTSAVLVTHQVNVTALTGVYPASGEGVVVRIGAGGDLEVVARVPPP